MGIHWLVSGILVAGLIWFSYNMQQKDHEASSMESGLYTGFSRLIWSILIWMVIYACITGHGGPVNAFLSLSMWRPLARLTYAIYIIHMPVMMLVTASARRPIYFSFRNMVRLQSQINCVIEDEKYRKYYAFLFQLLKYFGDMVAAILLAIILTLGIDSPVAALDNMIFGTRKKRNMNETPTNVTSRPLGFDSIQPAQPTVPVP